MSNKKDKGLKATAYRKGYVRYLYLDEYAISFNYDRDMWKNPVCLETPFWISIRNKDWDMTEELIKKHNVFTENRKQIHWGQIYIALEPLQNATFSEVCDDLKKQIERYIEIVC